MKLREHVVAYVSSLALLGTIVTILGFALPTSRSWLLRNAAAGWIVCAVLFVVAVGQAALLSTAQSQRDAATRNARTEADQRAADAEKRAATAETAREHAETTLAARLDADAARRDTLLLSEWLGVWRQGDEFMDYLKNQGLGVVYSVVI